MIHILLAFSAIQIQPAKILATQVLGFSQRFSDCGSGQIHKLPAAGYYTIARCAVGEFGQHRAFVVTQGRPSHPQIAFFADAAGNGYVAVFDSTSQLQAGELLACKSTSLVEVEGNQAVACSSVPYRVFEFGSKVQGAAIWPVGTPRPGG